MFAHKSMLHSQCHVFGRHKVNRTQTHSNTIRDLSWVCKHEPLPPDCHIPYTHTPHTLSHHMSNLMTSSEICHGSVNTVVNAVSKPCIIGFV